MITAGILSDTHLSAVTPQFRRLAHGAFSGCDVIFHAGDITAGTILDMFSDKTVHGVHGNMCDLSSRSRFPDELRIEIDGVIIGLCHGAGSRYNIEERVWSRFPDADIIIYGHTHKPVCQKKGKVWFINPGSFQCYSPHGSPASYAIVTIDKGEIDAHLQSISLK